jgi:hypothetical protein
MRNACYGMFTLVALCLVAPGASQTRIGRLKDLALGHIAPGPL